MLVLSILFISCKGNENLNVINKETFKKETEFSEKSKGRVSELPFGFQFGMSEEEINNLLETLSSQGIISSNGQNYKCNYITKLGVKIECHLNFKFHEDELYGVQLNMLNDSPETINAIETDLTEKCDSSYIKVAYSENFGDLKCHLTQWIKDNQIIFLRNAVGSDLNYINAPIAKMISDKRIDKTVEEARKNVDNITIKNSSWDGSVSQVKKYLNKNLNDPKSYESIEWSEALKTDKGYTVRHKYRARNSLGALVVENKVFYIDNKGNIDKVVDFGR